MLYGSLRGWACGSDFGPFVAPTRTNGPWWAFRAAPSSGLTRRADAGQAKVALVGHEVGGDLHNLADLPAVKVRNGSSLFSRQAALVGHLGKLVLEGVSRPHRGDPPQSAGCVLGPLREVSAKPGSAWPARGGRRRSSPGPAHRVRRILRRLCYKSPFLIAPVGTVRFPLGLMGVLRLGVRSR